VSETIKLIINMSTS